MPKPVIIEVAGEPRGIVTPLAIGYRFVAVRLAAFALDGKVFGTVAEARSAVQRAVRRYELDTAARDSTA